MKLKLLSILLPAVLCILKGFAATEPDSSVSITSSKNEYNFVYSTQAGAVQVKQKLSNTYISNDYQVSYPVSEIYNSRISINNVTCKVDGHTPKGFEPKYTYYGEDDVFYSSEQKLVIVMEAQRGEYSIAELCRKHGISQATFYKWNKEFMEAGKKRLSGDTTREATSDEVAELRNKNKELKELVADLLLENNILKKSIDRLA